MNAGEVAELIERYNGAWNAQDIETIHALHAGSAKVFFALGGNFLSAAPDTEYTATALRRALGVPGPCVVPPIRIE